MRNEIEAQVIAVRAFLEPLWETWKIERNRDTSAPPSASMCRFTAIFLKPILEENTGRRWKIAGGYEWMGDNGGMIDPHGVWRSHYWLTDGETIVDITADQFGHHPVIVTDHQDVRYRANFSSAEIRRHVADANLTPAAWRRIFDLTENFHPAEHPEPAPASCVSGP